MRRKFSSAILIIASLNGCDNSSTCSIAENENGLKEYLNKVKAEQVFVKGGQFKMGDFGIEHYKEHLPLDRYLNSKPLHKVTLSNFSISKFKTTNFQYQFYLKQTGRKLQKVDGDLSKKNWDDLNKLPDTPAHATWQQAADYCSWLAEKTNLPFTLPTEAQWEYAARSGGKYYVVGTDDGTWKIKDNKGINISTSEDRQEWSEAQGLNSSIYAAMPVDHYPPNPLGLYDISGNGLDWVKDWYDPNYYKYSPENDPQGPDNPSFKDRHGRYIKVARGEYLSDPGRGITITRKGGVQSKGDRVPSTTTIRCVVNSAEPIT